MKKRTMQKVWKWTQVLAVIYIGIGVLFYYFQERFIFQRVSLSSDHSYGLGDKATEINIPMNETDTINIQDFRSMDTIRRGIVLYFHGNRKNISWYAKYADGFTRNGYELLMMDYPGYGKSRGKITEQKLYNWALQVYKLALSRYAADSIIIYGKSLGTCIASQLAASRDCKRLILETPYYSMSRLTRNYLPIFPVNWLLRYEMPTWRYLQQVSAPISIFHGTKDRVISLKHSLLLKSFLKPGDELITANGAKHNGLFDYAEARYKLDSILRLR